MRLAKTTLLMVIGALLEGCATPRYQSVYRYEPPADAVGRACVTQCAQTQKLCLEDCRQNYTACVKHLEPEARARHADALERHEDAMDQYRRALDHYHLNLSLGWGHYDDWYGAGWYESRWPYGGYRYYDYPPPEPPRPPYYEDELARLSVEKCDQDCACQPDYENCFVGCGGRKISQQRCFANCPP